MLFKLFKTKIAKVNTLFVNHYVDVKAFYALKFNKVPCVSFIGELDTGQVFEYMNKTYGKQIIGIYQHNAFDHDKQQLFFNNCIFILKNNRMIEAGSNYCQVLYTNKQYVWAQEIVKAFAQFRLASANETLVGLARNYNMN
jgi:hypothetical protein